MQKAIRATPEKLIADATAFMVANGASVASRTEDSATFVARQAMSGLDAALLLGIGVSDFGGAMSAVTAHGVNSENSATLVAMPNGEVTNVTIADNETLANNLLRFWFVGNVLRESLPSPLQKIQASYHKVLIWNDRVEAHARIMRWKLADTIRMEDIATVETKKRLITVRSTDGREISIKGTTREDAEKAKGIIEGRVAVHKAPSLVGGAW